MNNVRKTPDDVDLYKVEKAIGGETGKAADQVTKRTADVNSRANLDDPEEAQ